MSTFIKGLTSGMLLLLLLGFAAYRILEWRHYVNVRAFYAEQAAVYLFNPSGVVDKDGKDLSRQEMLDWYLHEIVEKNPQLGVTFKKQ